MRQVRENELYKTLEKIGVSLYNEEGTFKSFEELFNELENKLNFEED